MQNDKLVTVATFAFATLSPVRKNDKKVETKTPIDYLG